MHKGCQPIFVSKSMRPARDPRIARAGRLTYVNEEGIAQLRTAVRIDGY